MSKLKEKIIIRGHTIAMSGLHIGGTNNAMGIGGTDKMVIRNPMTNVPYIPGSSLKGKMRSLIEQRDGTYSSKSMGGIVKGPSDDPDARSARLFGFIGGKGTDEARTQQPSRLIVRDGNLTTPEDQFTNTDLPYTETKTEVVIDRITSKAMPRQMERVPAGAEFELDMVLNVYDGEDRNKQLAIVFEALQLLSDDYLGGLGSRGSGRVAFQVTELKVRAMEYYRENQDEEDLIAVAPYQEMVARLLSYTTSAA